MSKPDIVDALTKLRPNAQWVSRGADVEWLDSVQIKPSQNEIENKLAELTVEYQASQYKRLRRDEYPTIEECIHAILDGEVDVLQAKRAEIKTKYPKNTG